MNLDRIGSITSELSTSLVRSILFPQGFLGWLSRPLADKLRVLQRPQQKILASGPIVLAGGKTIADETLVQMKHLVGGRTATLAILPVAATDPQETGEEVLGLLNRFGMNRLQVVDISTREQADSPEISALLRKCDGVILCGQDPARGIELLKESLVAHTLQEMLLVSKAVVGFGGGGAMLAERCLVQGAGQAEIIDGLGLVPDMVLDTDFSDPSGFGRLAAQMASQGGSRLAVGLESNTALVVRRGEIRVMGDQRATFLDAGDGAGCAPGAVCGLKVHVLGSGYGINLRNRKPYAVPKEMQAVAR